MESHEMQMSTNTPVVVGVDSKIPNLSRETTVMGNMPSTEINEQGREGQVEPVGISEQILSSAKEEGFEQALHRLADGDFEDRKIYKDQVSEPVLAEEVAGDAVEPGAASAGEEPLPEGVEPESTTSVPEYTATLERVKEMEAKVSNLEEKNKDLFEKVRTLENNNTLAMQTLLEMTLIMHEMIKDEQDEERKVSMLESLVNLMVALMHAMFIPEDGDGVKKASQEAKQQEVVRPGRKKRSIEEIVDDLRRKGKIRSERQIKNAAPTPETTQQAA